MKDSRLERAGVTGYNKPKRTPSHPTKSHIVVAKEGDSIKTIRFGQQGVKTNQTAGQREAFKSRHAKNISKGKLRVPTGQTRFIARKLHSCITPFIEHVRYTLHIH